MAFAVFGDGRSFEATTLFRNNNNNKSPTCHRNAFVGATDKASSLQQPSALSANIMMPVDSHRLPLSTMVKNGETLLTTAAGAAGEKTHTRSRAIAIKRAGALPGRGGWRAARQRFGGAHVRLGDLENVRTDHRPPKTPPHQEPLHTPTIRRDGCCGVRRRGGSR